MKKTGFKTQFIWNITWVFLQVAFYKQVIRVASFQFFSRWLRIYIFSKTKQNNYRRVHHRRGMTVKQIYLLGQNPLESNMHSLQTCLPPWYLTGKNNAEFLVMQGYWNSRQFLALDQCWRPRDARQRFLIGPHNRPRAPLPWTTPNAKFIFFNSSHVCSCYCYKHHKILIFLNEQLHARSTISSVR